MFHGLFFALFLMFWCAGEQLLSDHSLRESYFYDQQRSHKCSQIAHPFILQENIYVTYYSPTFPFLFPVI